MPVPDTPRADVRPLDAIAVQRALQRMAEREPPWLHVEVARRMGERLAVIRKQPQTVLDWSGRLGASAQVLRAVYPKARLLSVEPMQITQAPAGEQPARWWSPRRWRAGDAPITPDAVLPASGELLWANMMLHACIDPPQLFATWHRALAVEGFLMFSTFGPGTLPELRALYAQHGWGPAGAEFVDMHDLGDMLVHAGFADPVMDQELITLTFASPQAALAELRTLGGNAALRRHPGLRTPRWHAALQRALESRATADGRVALRFEVAYGHAFRPVAKARVQAHTEVPLDAMREMMRAGRREPR